MAGGVEDYLSIVLYCIVSYCIASYCIVMYCIVVYGMTIVKYSSEVKITLCQYNKQVKHLKQPRMCAVEASRLTIQVVLGLEPLATTFIITQHRHDDTTLHSRYKAI